MCSLHPFSPELHPCSSCLKVEVLAVAKTQVRGCAEDKQVDDWKAIYAPLRLRLQVRR